MVTEYDKYMLSFVLSAWLIWNADQCPQLQYSVHISPTVSILSCLSCSVQRLNLDQFVFLISAAIFDRSFDK